MSVCFPWCGGRGRVCNHHCHTTISRTPSVFAAWDSRVPLRTHALSPCGKGMVLLKAQRRGRCYLQMIHIALGPHVSSLAGNELSTSTHQRYSQITWNKDGRKAWIIPNQRKRKKSPQISGPPSGMYLTERRNSLKLRASNFVKVIYIIQEKNPFGGHR